MEYVNSVRRIDELGRVVLPIEVRRMMNWDEKTSVEILANETKGGVFLRQYPV